MDTRDLTVIVPVLDESARVASLCSHLNFLPCPVIVVDGGSTDRTYSDLCTMAAANVRVVQTETGRARQMNFGASLAETTCLLFLHADTMLPSDGINLATDALARMSSEWGRFDVTFDENSPAMNTIARFMNHRSILTGICTGDQAIFTTARVFEAAGGYPEIPLMEDIELSKRLRRTGWPIRIRAPVVTASRRWRKNGVFRTVGTMWWLRILYWTGVSPGELAERYGHAR